MQRHSSELTVVMDSNYWINFEKDRDIYLEFHEAKDKHEFSVTYTRPNFVDMANTDQQDNMSSIIADTADAYMAVDTYNAGEYYRDENPTVLTRPESRAKFNSRTAELDEKDTLKYLFRNINQRPEESAAILAQQIKSIYDEYGRSRAELCAFGTKVRREEAGEEDETRLYVDIEDVHDMELIRKMLVVEHAVQIKEGEKIGTQDYVDMEICAYATFEADVFVGEEKWIDQGIIEEVCKPHSESEIPITVSSHKDLLDVVSSAPV